MKMRLLLLAAFVLLVGCAGMQNPFKRGGADVEPPAAVEQIEAAAVDPAPEPETPEAEVEVEAPAAAPEKPAVKPDANAAARARCLAETGNFTRTKSGAFVCVTRTRDSGKVCSSSNHCQGACLARSGTCSPVVPLIGCNDIVTAKGGMATVCID